ncbi:MAG: hypothetical protein HRT87_01570 [Legionellales bacterium]|nr:hypothetical protein [Legionellales bacterium]
MTDSKKELSRELTWFHKEGEDEFVVGRESLENVPVEILAKIIESITDEDDPDMYFVYSADHNYLKQIQPFIKHKIDLDKYEYDIFSYKKE